MHIRITYCWFTIPSIWTFTTIYIQRRGSAVSPLVHIQPTCFYIIITDFTIRSTNFQHIQNSAFFQEFHKRFFTNHPSDSTGIKECKTIFFAELLGTIISTIIFNKIPIRPIISSTECPVFTIVRNFTSCSRFLTTEQSHKGNIMLSKTTGPI